MASFELLPDEARFELDGKADEVVISNIGNMKRPSQRSATLFV
jgi:hypothetical protein